MIVSFEFFGQSRPFSTRLHQWVSAILSLILSSVDYLAALFNYFVCYCVSYFGHLFISCQLSIVNCQLSVVLVKLDAILSITSSPKFCQLIILLTIFEIWSTSHFIRRSLASVNCSSNVFVQSRTISLPFALLRLNQIRQ